MDRISCRLASLVTILAMVMLVSLALTGPAGVTERKVIKIGPIEPLSMKEGVEIQQVVEKVCCYH